MRQNQTQVLLGKMEDWKEKQELAMQQWLEQLSLSIHQRHNDLVKEFEQELKTKRFKDVSLTFAIKRKGEQLKLVEGYKNRFRSLEQELNKNQIKQNDLEQKNYTIEKLKEEVEEQFQQGAKQVMQEVNQIVKRSNVKFVIKNGEIALQDIPKLQNQKLNKNNSMKM